MLELKINGETRRFPDPLTVAGLVEQLGYTDDELSKQVSRMVMITFTPGCVQ